VRRQIYRAMGIRFVGALLITSYATGAGAQTNDVWKIYSNARYGYSLCYPGDLFQPGPEPDAHDGVRFQGPPGVTLIVEGSYNAASDTPSSAAANELTAVAGGPIQITYRAAKNNWAVASGIAEGKIFFVRQVLYGDMMLGFEIVYPVREKIRFDSVVARLNTCLNVEKQNHGSDAAAKIAERKETPPRKPYCGIVHDYGDSYRIMDGKFNPYWDRSDLAPPRDPKGLVSSPLLREGNCLCVEGALKTIPRGGGGQSYVFADILNMTTCDAKPRVPPH
jgi:hypothetical protein